VVDETLLSFSLKGRVATVYKTSPNILHPYDFKAFCILFSFRLSFIWLRSVFIFIVSVVAIMSPAIISYLPKHKAKDQE
jgi:hypothetical protein